MRARAFMSIVLVAMSVLLVTGAVTVVHARRTAVDVAKQELEKRASRVARSLELVAQKFDAAAASDVTASSSQLEAFRSAIAGTLRISGGSLVVVDTHGSIHEGVSDLFNLGQQPTLLDLPSPLRADDLDPVALLAGETQSGSSGALAFLAVPLNRAQHGDQVPVLVLSEPIAADPLATSETFFVVSAIAVTLLAALASAVLARRLIRPLTAMEATAQQLADGNLDARLELPHHPDRELEGLARALDVLGDQLGEARELERAFVLNVSHDLRTPLTSIRGYAEALEDGTLDEAEGIRRAGHIITTEANRLQRLVQDLLDLGRLDMHAFSIQPRPFDVAESLRGLVNAFMPDADANGLEIHTELPDTMVAVSDPARIEQAAANLIENALKYAERTVIVAAAKRTDRLSITVTDDGPGIPSAERTRIFERLYTANANPGRKIGTGLGLAIVHQLATLLGGTITLDDSVENGSRFIMIIPANPGAAPEPTSGRHPEKPDR